MTIIALQCRLASTRLASKALLKIGNYELFRWALRALKNVVVDQYWVACDEDSYSILSKIAKEEGWQCFFGSAHNVLERYCSLIKKTGAEIVLRATADNPFLFYEAAQESLLEFNKLSCDYFAFSGLPHGSGIEVFSAKALLEAQQITNDSYDLEHVGPALYNHSDTFNCIFKKAPFEWTHEYENFEYRTTIDTIKDYRHALRINDFLQQRGSRPPYSAKDIFSALQSLSVRNPVLFVPAIQNGRGTGHVRRVVSLIKNLKKEHNIFADILLEGKPSVEANKVLKEALNLHCIQEHNILTEPPEQGEYACIICDSFVLNSALAKKLYSCAPIIAIDEGSKQTKMFEYLLNILPPLNTKKSVNAYSPQYLNLPQTQQRKLLPIKKVLISIGGEDPENFSKLVFNCLQSCFKNKDVTIDCTAHQKIENLKNIIKDYDLVVTHYGFTAFEAANAGCALITVATSPLHKKLSRKYGLVCLEKSECTKKKLVTLIQDSDRLIPYKLQNAVKTRKNDTLEDFLLRCWNARQYNCPICGKQDSINPIIARDNIKTLRKCKRCKLLYVSFCVEEKKEYVKDYFFDEYKNQYGKTYLEDFEMIKSAGSLRMEKIVKILKNSHNNVEDTILDIGCAYGPFLEAVKEYSFKPYGTDISKDAIDYVNNTLCLTCAVASFPDFSVEESFGELAPKSGTFRAITMWYVIEHFQNLDEVLKKVNVLLDIGGVFAFSTPNALGISRRKNQRDFFKQSPYDHFSIWDKKTAKKILKRYGFSVQKIYSTGMHWHRYPKIMQKLPIYVIELLAKIFCLGDTFEVYCTKEKEIK